MRKHVVRIFIPLCVLLSWLPSFSRAETRVTYDLGVSTGSVNDVSYTEANLGLNVFFEEWFAWRNSVFARFGDKVEEVQGLDTSLRLVGNVGEPGAIGFNAFLGPGYRFVTKGNSVPFAEGGLVLKLGGLAIGGGAKVLFHEFVDKNFKNETQYFIILAGGGAL